MSTSLTVLRRQTQQQRFERLKRDDSRTAISPSAAHALEHALEAAIDGEVRFDQGSRALYATDGSNYRQTPIGVVVPRNIEDVIATVKLAREFGAPILNRGCGTSLAGQCCNVAVLLDFSKYMHHVVKFDPERRLGHVQPGCILDTLRHTGTRLHGLTFGPDPATHDHCTLGGMLGNNSCGSHSLLSKNHGMGVRCSDNVHELDILTYDGTRMTVGATAPDQLEAIIRGGGRRGEIYASLKQLVEKYGDTIRNRFPRLDRRVSGYNLNDLLPENGFHVARALVGSESTLVTILQASLHLVPAPKTRTVVMLGFSDIYVAAEHSLAILKFKPNALEGMDDLLFDYVKRKGDENANLALLPKGGGYMLVEFGADTQEESDDTARRMIDHLKQMPSASSMDARLYDTPEQAAMIWKVREGGLAATAWVPGNPDTWPGWEDSAVPVEKVSPYLRELRKLFHKYGYNPAIYGHLGQGCIHCRVGFDLYTQPGIDNFRKFMDEATDLVSSMGGSYSGEHGDGQARGEYLPKMFGSEAMEAFRQFKRIWDPHNKMNPGKVINLDGPAYSITDNLRLGTDYNPPRPQTYFAYTADRNSYARAALRCVGVGKCRTEKGGTMCPSFRVTREEKHSTRGRARMLFEMMNGEIIEEGWRSEEVLDALDLCLSCKGCKGDCPVNVDMATYKAEFLAHHYKGRLRPRHAYAFGWIHVWSTLASVAPMAANFLTQTPGLSRLAKWAAGVDQHRHVPPFSPQTFKQWVQHRQPKHPNGRPVLLFADTFNNHFHPDIAQAALEVLEAAGFHVIVPMADVCCGRPLYDYGFLNMAKRWWVDMLEKLRPYLQNGIPMVVLEPSCWSAFKDELTNLLPESEDAKRLAAQTFTLSRFLVTHAPHFRPPELKMKALLQGHCHQKSLDALNDKQYGKLNWEKKLFRDMKVEFTEPEEGCCGMAGAFGYEEGEHYQVGLACGEKALLPAVRKAAEDQLIVADGFSCQEQIEQETPRQALHMAQVLQLALRQSERGLPSGRPEREIQERRQHNFRLAAYRAGALALLGVAAGAAAYVATRRRTGITPSRHQRWSVLKSSTAELMQ